MTLELQYLSADVLGLPGWAARALAERPRPARLAGVILPHELAAVPRPDERHDEEARAALAEALERELARFQPHVAVLESVRALRASGTTMIVAGQQPALLGGPLFDLYKALHAVVLARALTRTWETPVVPVFWNHADDHDVAEVHHLWIQNPHLDLRKVALAGLSSGRTPLSGIVFDEEQHHLRALAELLRQNLWEGPEQAHALELFMPRAGESFSGAFTRTLLELFGHLGLVVVEPQWIRGPMSATLAHLVARELEPALVAGAENLRARGGEVAIDPREAALVFRSIAGKRHALRLADGVYRFDGESGSRTAAELAAEIVQEPDDWSPGALLRPIVQDLVLPVAAYIGGWGELAYHAQLGALRTLAELPPSVFVPRLSGTLVDAATHASLVKLGLELGDVLRARAKLELEPEAVVESAVATRLRELARRYAGELVLLRGDVSALDPGLGEHVKRTARQIEDSLETLAAKLERVQSNSAGSEKRHRRRLTNGLFPNEQPQERVRGTLEFVARYGTAWIDELLALIDPLPTEHLVVRFPT